MRIWRRITRSGREQLEAAATAFFRRHYHIEHPNGGFMMSLRTRSDISAPWYPSAAERQACCKHVSPPSLGDPLTLNEHCRSEVHLAKLYNVDLRALRKQIRLMRRRGPGAASRILWDSPIDADTEEQPAAVHQIAVIAGQPGKLPFQPSGADLEIDELLSEIGALIKKGDNS